MENVKRKDSREFSSIQDTFLRVSPYYDLLNTLFSAGLDALWRKALKKSCLSAISDGECRILDAAAGTLKVSRELIDELPKAHVYAVDLSLPMLLTGWDRVRAEQALRLHTAQADVYDLPFPDNSFHAATLAFGLRNMSAREAALAEIYRVLKPGGSLTVLEFASTQDKLFFGLYNWYVKRVIPRVAQLVVSNKNSYEYLAESMFRYPKASVIRSEMETAGFRQVSFRPLTFSIVYLHQGVKL